MSKELKVQRECQKGLLQIIEHNDEILTVCLQTVIERHPTATKRMTILLAAAMKTRELKKAITLLGSSKLNDEMLVLLRTMMELIVNTCYLQDSSEQEVDRYLNFDAIAHHTALQAFMAATQGSFGSPSLAKPLKAKAKAASDASGIKLGSRKWAVEHQTLESRAMFADKVLGSNLLSTFLAAVYGLSSGYTHASYQTLSKHAKYLATREKQHSLHTYFGVTNALLGLSYAQGVLNRYLARRFNFPMDSMINNSTEANRLVDVSREDFARHKQSLEARMRNSAE